MERLIRITKLIVLPGILGSIFSIIINTHFINMVYKLSNLNLNLMTLIIATIIISPTILVFYDNSLTPKIRMFFLGFTITSLGWGCGGFIKLITSRSVEIIPLLINLYKSLLIAAFTSVIERALSFFEQMFGGP